MTPWIVAYQAPLSVHGILRARTLEWTAIPFSRGLPNPRSNLHLLHWRWIFFFFLPLSHQGSLLHKFSSVQLLSHVQLFVIPWIVAFQAFISYHSFNSHKVPEKILLAAPFFRWRARSLEKLTYMPQVSAWDATSSFPNIADYVLSHQLIRPAQFPAPHS